jgi:protein-L-isoaspartate O-methyltransferase
MPDPSPFSWNPPSEASRAREVLDRAGYDEPTIAKLLGTGEIPPASQRRLSLPLYLWRCRGDGALETLVRLFLLNQAVALDVAGRALAPVPLTEWVACGLLAAGATEVQAAVELVPYQGLLLAVDRADTTVAEPVMEVAATTRVLAQLTVRRAVQRSLDLGTGSGVQALLAARHSEHVSATELNPRAIQLAQFNAALNGVSNVSFLAGDWLGPVQGQTFDLIVVNPPFVIAPSQRQLHSHSGRAADHLCRDLIRSAPPFLREDGYFQLAGNWAHTIGQDWRDRLAEWFAGSGCDAWVLHGEPDDVATYALARIRETATDAEEPTRLFDEWMAYYQRERIEAVGAGVITLRRSAGRSNWVRFDRFPGVSGTGTGAIEQGFALRDFLEANPGDRELLKTRLRRADHLRWIPQYSPSQAGWSVAASRLRLTDGLGFAGEVDPIVAEFVARCTGAKPLDAMLKEFARSRGQQPDQLTSAFLPIIRGLLEKGVLLPVDLGLKRES